MLLTNDGVVLQLFCNVLMFALVLVAAAIDIATRKIPNTLTYPAIIIALVLGSLSLGITSSVAGLLVAAVPALLLFAFGSLGGGDVKLLAAVGAGLGVPLIIDGWLYILFCAVVVGFLQILIAGRLQQITRSFVVACRSLIYPGVPADSASRDFKMPFAVPIAGGVICAMIAPDYLASILK